jgi:hypothetical protein
MLDPKEGKPPGYLVAFISISVTAVWFLALITIRVFHKRVMPRLSGSINAVPVTVYRTMWRHQ